MDWNQYRRLEFGSPAEVRQVQEDLLNAPVAHCARHSPYYRRILEARGLGGRRFTLERLGELPLTDKNTFDQRNDDFLAAPPSTLADIALSSGTTGRPTRVAYTENDLDRLAHNEEISFLGCGVGPGDVALLTCTMDRCFIAGLAYYTGLRRLGAAVIRNGLNTLESHAEIVRRFRPTVLVGVPTFLRKAALIMR